jgi:predicted protein tyrosine phosphatase
MRKVLFVCTANIQRSPTAERLFRDWNGIWEAKSAGVTPHPSGNPLTEELIDWADVIIVIEQIHAEEIQTRFHCAIEKLRILNIPDKYHRDDPELIRELKRKIPPLLETNRVHFSN